MSSVNSFQCHVRLSVWTTNSAFRVTLLFYIHPQYTYQPPEMNVSILSVHYEVHPVVLSMNYISIIATSSSHIRGYSILLVEIRMSTRWSTECIVDGLVQNPSCPSFFDHPKTLNSLEFSQNNEYCVALDQLGTRSFIIHWSSQLYVCVSALKKYTYEIPVALRAHH